MFQALNDKASNLFTQLSSTSAYIAEILSIQEDKLQQFILERRIKTLFSCS
ncbi:hypothetical protein ACEQPO_09390 [Bacillus sp. SL00103]